MNEHSLAQSQDRLTKDEPLHILCVDDDANVLRSLRRLFRNESFRTLTALSGKEGLAFVRSTVSIGLILSDQRMPEMSGSAFLEAARALKPDIPRIILTGYADAQSSQDAVNQGGAYRLIAKPWNDEELLLAVRDGLERYQNQRV